MKLLTSHYADHRADNPAFSNQKAGFSLIEVMMIMVLLSLTIVPFTLMASQTAKISRGVYLQSSRKIALASSPDQMDPDRQDYYTAFDNTSLTVSTTTQTVTDSGQTIPFLTRVDTANTDAFDKTAYVYAYTDTTDAANTPKYTLTMFNSSDIVRMRCGNTASFVDSSGMLWVGDQAYDGTKKQPGYSTAGTTGSSATTLPNTTDDQLFQSWRTATNMDYRFDVPNGDYVVMLYFAEMSGATTTRDMDISLEGTVQASAYNAYTTMGTRYYYGTYVSYDVTVSDGVLNIDVDRAASAGTNDPRLSGIIVKKKWIQP
jgi:hypothetical protein